MPLSPPHHPTPVHHHRGVQCLRHEIRDIHPPQNLQRAMEMQSEAERRKRALVLESEGARQAEINRAEGQKQHAILMSEAAREDAVNRAKGDAEAAVQRAEASARSLRLMAEAMEAPGGERAAQVRVAERYIEAFGAVAKEGNTTILLPGDPAAVLAQALSVWKAMNAMPDGGLDASAQQGAVAAAGGLVQLRGAAPPASGSGSSG